MVNTSNKMHKAFESWNLAKSDLAYYYKQSIDGIEEAKKESWKIYNDQTVPMREKLLALKLIIQSDETRFKSTVRRTWFTGYQIFRG